MGGRVITECLFCLQVDWPSTSSSYKWEWEWGWGAGGLVAGRLQAEVYGIYRRAHAVNSVDL